MTENLKKEHYNLYYIFLEDKQINALSNQKVAEKFIEIKRRLDRFSPPNE